MAAHRYSFFVVIVLLTARAVPFIIDEIRGSFLSGS
jgi:hypothetical protein